MFGTGDHLQAVTVTANSGFLRAAENQVALTTHAQALDAAGVLFKCHNSQSDVNDSRHGNYNQSFVRLECAKIPALPRGMASLGGVGGGEVGVSETRVDQRGRVTGEGD